MITRAKFEVSRVTEMGYSGKRQEILRIKKHVAANTEDPEDGTITRYDRTEYESSGVPIREIVLSAVCDDGLAMENKSFSTATPSGTITFILNNATLADEFKPGNSYYVDFTPVS